MTRGRGRRDWELDGDGDGDGGREIGSGTIKRHEGTHPPKLALTLAVLSSICLFTAFSKTTHPPTDQLQLYASRIDIDIDIDIDIKIEF